MPNLNAVDEQVRRQARARAEAVAIVDAPHLGRRLHVPERLPLQRSPRRRFHARTAIPAALNAPIVTRRRVAAALLVAQIMVLAGFLFLPSFRATSVKISGAHLISRQAILQTAELVSSPSVFTLDGEGIRNRLLALPWVRAASVDTELPNTVHISIAESLPALRVHAAHGDVLISADGATLPMNDLAGAPPAVPTIVDDRPGSNADAPVNGALIRALAAIAANFPTVYGCNVSVFEWQSNGALAIVTAAGWRAILGVVDTDAQVAAIPNQLATLAAIHAKLDFAKPNFGYIDLEDPNAPAVGGKPGMFPPVAISPAPAPVATSPATPTPTAGSGGGNSGNAVPPTTSPTPGPLHLVVAPPH